MLFILLLLTFFLACPKKPPPPEKKVKEREEDIVAKVEKLKFEEVKETLVADPYIMFNLGVRKEVLGELEEAKKFYRYAVELKPSFVEAWINLAWVERKLGNVRGMIDVMESAVEVNSTDPRVWATLAIAYTEAGEPETAQEKIRWALANLGISKEIAIAMGYNLIAQNKLQLAYFVFDELKRKYPQDFQVLSLSGYVLFKLGYCKEAVEDFAKALSVRADPKVLTNMGVCLIKLDRIQEAEQAFREAIKLDPNFWKAHLNLGNVLRRKGRWEEAEKHYLSALTGARAEGKEHIVLLSIANLYETVASYNAIQTHRALEYLEKTLDVLKKVISYASERNINYDIKTLERRIRKIERQIAKLRKKLERELKRKK